MPQEVLTRRRPPAVARALRDTRRTPRGGSVALGAPVRRRRAPRAARVPRSPRTGQGAETLLAVVGLGAEQFGGLAAWSVGRLARVAEFMDARAVPDLRRLRSAEDLRAAARVSVAELPAWLFQVGAIAVGLGLTGVGALSAARAALGPATGTGVLGAAMPSMLVLVLAMAAVLLALRRLARGGEDHRPVWLVGLATLVLVAS